MNRAPLLRRPPEKVLGQYAAPCLKQKTCKVCKAKYTGGMPLSTVCGYACAQTLAVSVRGKLEKIKAVRERKADKVQRDKLKTRGQWLAEAKKAAQKFRRFEELARGYGCMSCGRTQEEVNAEAWKPGGAWDGGHFLSKGARPELALEPLNIWLQCKSCNAGSSKYARKGYTVNASFRLNLIERIGLEAVEALESDNAPKHYTTDQIKAIKADYMAKTRELLKAAA
jgi:hypothetical protein